MLIYRQSIGYEEDSNEPLSGLPRGVGLCCLLPMPHLPLLGHVIVSFGDVWRGQPVATPSHTSFGINKLIKQYLI